MNIRELIDEMQKIAEMLPDGLDSQVRVSMCHGHDEPMVLTPTVVTDVMFVQDKDTLEVQKSFAIVQGHPHRDQDNEFGTLRPVTSGLDEVAQRWAEEQGKGSAD